LCRQELETDSLSPSKSTSTNDMLLLAVGDGRVGDDLLRWE
jgi:hypothetical protein